VYGMFQMFLHPWVQRLRLGHWPRCGKRAVKSRKMVKSDLLEKRKFTSRSKVGGWMRIDCLNVDYTSRGEAGSWIKPTTSTDFWLAVVTLQEAGDNCKRCQRNS
jgi:hypothetical protein